MKIKEIWKNVSDFVEDHETGVSCVIAGAAAGLLVITGFKLGEFYSSSYTHILMSSDAINKPDLTLKDFMKNHGMID